MGRPATKTKTVSATKIAGATAFLSIALAFSFAALTIPNHSPASAAVPIACNGTLHAAGPLLTGTMVNYGGNNQTPANSPFLIGHYGPSYFIGDSFGSIPNSAGNGYTITKNVVSGQGWQNGPAVIQICGDNSCKIHAVNDVTRDTCTPQITMAINESTKTIPVTGKLYNPIVVINAGNPQSQSFYAAVTISGNGQRFY